MFDPNAAFKSLIEKKEAVMENYIRDDENEKWKESREGRKQLNLERINVLNALKSRRDDIKRQKKVASHVKR